MTAPAAKAVAPYQVGGWYQQQNGEWVQFVGVENAGTAYECMYSIDPVDGHRIHRYTTRDYGRVTGTDHGYSDKRNTPPLIPAESLAALERRVESLLSRLRPDIECAPWVIAELKSILRADGTGGLGGWA